jgi:hypothetical protein
VDHDWTVEQGRENAHGERDRDGFVGNGKISEAVDTLPDATIWLGN